MPRYSFLFAVFTTVACGCSQESKQNNPTPNIISIQVKGATIDALPSRVSIITADPAKAVSDLIESGAGERDPFPHHAIRHGVPHGFFTPKEWSNLCSSPVFQNGDVIYDYLFDSADEKDAFVRRYGLEKNVEIEYKEANDEIKIEIKDSLYIASPQYYVRCSIKTIMYTCPMHPLEKNVQKPGKCPICEMSLVGTPVSMSALPPPNIEQPQGPASSDQ